MVASLPRPAPWSVPSPSAAWPCWWPWPWRFRWHWSSTVDLRKGWFSTETNNQVVGQKNWSWELGRQLILDWFMMIYEPTYFLLEGLPMFRSLHVVLRRPFLNLVNSCRFNLLIQRILKIGPKILTSRTWKSWWACSVTPYWWPSCPWPQPFLEMWGFKPPHWPPVPFHMGAAPKPPIWVGCVPRTNYYFV